MKLKVKTKVKTKDACACGRCQGRALMFWTDQRKSVCERRAAERNKGKQLPQASADRKRKTNV